MWQSLRRPDSKTESAPELLDGLSVDDFRKLNIPVNLPQRHRAIDRVQFQDIIETLVEVIEPVIALLAVNLYGNRSLRNQNVFAETWKRLIVEKLVTAIIGLGAHLEDLDDELWVRIDVFLAVVEFEWSAKSGDIGIDKRVGDIETDLHLVVNVGERVRRDLIVRQPLRQTSQTPRCSRTRF